MSIVAQIKDGEGSSNKLKIGEDGELTVTISSHPPSEEKHNSIPFRSFFENSAGSSDMIVNGSVTPVSFEINASPLVDRYIKTISIKLADAGARFNLFGALSALTNGVRFVWESQAEGTIIIDEIKDNVELFRLSGQTPIIIDISGGGADALIVNINMSVIFSMPFGIKLRKGTKDKLCFVVRDNLAGLDEYNTVGLGIEI